MKKIINVLLVFCLLLTCVSPAWAAEGWTQRTNSVDLRIGIIGDTHAGSGQTTNFTNNLDAHKTLGGNKLDGFILTGDIVYQQSSVDSALYDGVVSALNEANLPYAYAMGNHEYPLHASSETLTASSRDAFTQKTGKNVIHIAEFGTENDKYYAVAAAAEDYAGHVSAETESALKTAIDKAIAKSSTNANGEGFDEGVIPNSKKPVFVALHHPIDGTIFNDAGPSDGVRGYTEDFVAYLKTRPQVIVLTGHRHVPQQLPCTIWQDGFTIYQTSVSAGGSLVAHGCDEGDVSGESQSSMIEVKDNVVSIVKLDLKNKEYIGEPWVIDIPSIVADRTDADSSNDNDSYLYSADKRENPVNPQFPTSAEIAVTITDEINASITIPNSAFVTGETPNQQDGFVRGYKVEITENKSGKIVASKIYQNEYYSDVQSKSFTYNLSLNYGTSYTAKAYPMGALGGFGRPITKIFKTGAENVPEGAQRFEFDAVDDEYKRTDLGGSDAAVIASMGVFTNEGSYYSIPFTVTLDADGVYELSTVMLEQIHKTNYSKVELLFGKDGEEKTVVFTNNSQYEKNLKGAGYYSVSASGSYGEVRLYRAIKELTAGTYNVELRVYERSAGGKNITFSADYFQIAPYDYPVVTDEASVKIEYESYASQVDSSFKRDDDDASGKAYLGSGGAVINGTESYTLKTRINIPADGKYDVSYIARASSNDTSVVEFSFVNSETDETVTIGKNDSTMTESIADGTYGGFGGVGRYDKKDIALNAGVYDVTTVIHDSYNTAYKFYMVLDYIEIKAGAKKLISGTEDTYFELEDYSDTSSSGDNEVIIDESGVAHGGKFMKDTWSWVDPSAEIPVYIESSGYYDIEYAAGVMAGGTSQITFYLGETVLGCNRDGDSDGTEDNGVATYVKFESGYTGCWSSCPFAKFTNSKVWLEKGPNVLKAVFGAGGTANNQNLYKYNVDYIAFKPYEKPVVSDTAPTIFELDEYVSSKVENKDLGADDGDNELTYDENASGKYYIEDTWSYTDPSFELPIKVLKSGYYDFEYVIGKPKDVSDYSMVTLSVGDTVIGDNTAQSGGTKVENIGMQYSSAEVPFYKFNKERIWLNGGESILKMTVDDVGNPLHFTYRADYVKVSPSVLPEVLNNGALRIEFEDYMAETGTPDGGYNKVTPDSDASGGKYVQDSWSMSNPEISVPLVVKESGYYNIEYVIGYAADTGSYGKTELYMENEKIGDSTESGILVESYDDTKSIDLPMHKYVKKVWLDEGYNTFKFSVTNSGPTGASYKVYKYRADYVQFAPCEGLNVNASKIIATASYSEAVSGKAILALYNGDGTILSIIDKDVENVTAIIMETTETRNFAKAVIFIWDSYENLVPESSAKRFLYN